MQEILNWWWALEAHDKFAYMLGLGLLGFWIIYDDYRQERKK